MTLALCGCPNCGKTTLFNLLTGEAQRTGNWPGVTVQLASGMLSPAFWPDPSTPVRIVDLPGTLSLTPLSPDEAVPIQFLRRNPPDAVILLIDSCDPAQGLSLALQLRALRLPLVIAFNMSDRMHALGGRIRLERLSSLMQLPCLLISARESTGIAALVHTALQAKAPPLQPAITSPAVRWKTVDRLLDSCFLLPERSALSRPDKVLLHPLFSYPILIFVLICLFFFAFGSPGRGLSQLLSRFFNSTLSAISQVMTNANTPRLLHALLTDGLMRSLTSVLTFLPVLLIFFFCTALLEDSGYLSRAAFLLDAPLMRFHLSGRSFFSLITGLGCSVPAILSTQALASSRERRRAAVLIPLLPCSAKLPVILYLSAYCFDGQPFWLVLLCYGSCLMLLLLVSLCLPGQKAPPLIMDFPPLRLPTLRGALRAMHSKTRDFIVRAFTLIFFTSVIVWLLKSFTPALQYTANAENSLLFSLSKRILPLLQPLGLSSPECAAALLCGLLAKENILSVLALAPSGALFPTRACALSFLTFSLLYAPCASACAALTQILKSRKRMLCAVLLQTAFAWLAACIIYRLFSP